MSHVAIRIVVATRAQPCEVCGRDVQPGERIEYHAGPPRGVKHIECGLRTRRARR